MLCHLLCFVSQPTYVKQDDDFSGRKKALSRFSSARKREIAGEAKTGKKYPLLPAQIPGQFRAVYWIERTHFLSYSFFLRENVPLHAISHRSLELRQIDLVGIFVRLFLCCSEGKRESHLFRTLAFLFRAHIHFSPSPPFFYSTAALNLTFPDHFFGCPGPGKKNLLQSSC